MIRLRQATLLATYDSLAKLLEKLPGGLQRPILKELQPIRSLFLEQRPARILLFGGPDGPTPQGLLASLGIEAQLNNQEASFLEFVSSSGALLHFFDFRAEISPPHCSIPVVDVVWVVEDTEPATQNWQKTCAQALDTSLPVIALTTREDFFKHLKVIVSSSPDFCSRVSASLWAGAPAAHETLCAALPLACQLEFARFTGARRAQAHIASSLLKSFSPVCGIIGLQPIPFADLPILVTIQSLMVGLIIHASGRAASPRLIAEFLGALGIGTAAGFAFREAARAVVHLLPIWGNAVSGFIAGVGTYAIGRAAIAYFIEHSPLDETRRLFKKILNRGTLSSSNRPAGLLENSSQEDSQSE